MNAIQETVLDIIAKEGGIPRDSIQMDSTLQDLNVHSLDGVQIIFTLEDKFGINVPEEQVKHATGTVRELIEGVEKLVAEKGQGAARHAA